jgi:hypothetical protein
MIGHEDVRYNRASPEPGLRIVFVPIPDGNLVELLSNDETVANS